MHEPTVVIAFGVLAFVGVLLAVRAVLSRVKSPVLVEQLTAEQEDAQFCLCGDKATQPMPYIEREREAETAVSVFLMRHHDRNVYAAPPRLRRTVDEDGAKTLCRVHAHVADAKIDAFLYGRVRAVLAEANSQIALEAASFEKESLQKALKDSLTAPEKLVVSKLPKSNGLNGSTPTQPSVLS